ncbi:aminoacylase-1-like [Scaptodrosophila lebanonensis]|uniref:N-acyl-aliphatic-L-amino acid amidohydrolase n=1 Tax=Drosophila lebanonensis TaxID=7225 RepID=A0A6J2TSC6_DROLE|nr:aminoacylase-1-like [Scaptodrosophila lebanonensis]
MSNIEKWEKNEEIAIFREYLRIPTVQPDIDYTECVAFLRRQAASLDLPVEVVHPVVPSKPVVVMKWMGSEPALPALLLNSHMDVVPVYPERWTNPPFSAHLAEDGRIYARGAQDMKCVAMQYLGAIRALKASGYQPRRTVFLSFVPDEEIGGAHGMKDYVNTKHFKDLNIGFALDEGMADEGEIYSVFYAERTLWHLKLNISGAAGHGLMLLPNTAGEKLNYVTQKLMQFRAGERQRLLAGGKSLGDVTTVNLTVLRGGVQTNVLPSLIEATFDIRFSLDVDMEAFEQQLRDWCEEAGGGIEVEFVVKNPRFGATAIDDSNPYWLSFKSALEQFGERLQTLVLPGATDVRYVRNAGIPALGFSPIKHTPRTLHDDNEWLHADTYLHGIEVYKRLIPALADTQA